MTTQIHLRDSKAYEAMASTINRRTQPERWHRVEDDEAEAAAEAFAAAQWGSGARYERVALVRDGVVVVEWRCGERVGVGKKAGRR